MRILFVTPYPPSRIRVRGYGFLTHLQRKHDVTVVTQCSSERELADVETLRAQGYTVEVVQESRQQSMLRSGVALFTSQPLQVAYARSLRFAQQVQHLCAQNVFDVVHVEHLRGIASLQEIASLPPLVWDAVDCISLLFEHTMKAGASLPVRTVAKIEYERTRRYEARLLGELEYGVITSERDRQAMLDLYRAERGHASDGAKDPRMQISIVPNGVDLEYFRPLEQERRPANLVFLGKMSYHANVAAALYLHQQIMPLIWQSRPETTLTIVGSNPPESIRRLASNPRVEVTGYVDDIRPYVGRAEIMVSPMVYSVGIQNKVMEAMALGTPVVAATQVATALGAEPGRDLLAAQSAQEFAEKTLHLMDNADLRGILGRRGRTYVEQTHDWTTVTDRLVDVYQQAIAARAGKAHASISARAAISG
jgi:sugar transferase (PEP-CTERM/EpsH1 system associated)